MKVLKILTAPNPVLDSPSKKVVKIDEKIKKLVADMEATLVAQTDPQGVGLAAVQIGSLLQLFIMKQSPKAKTVAFINPKIVKNKSEDDKFSPSTTTGQKQLASSDRKTKSSLEGCLSIPRIWSPVRRQPEVSITYQDLNGVQKKATFTKLPAIIVQHELDHLAGILFTRRAVEQKSQLYEEINGELEKMKY
jgi:peptide deformylase